MVVEAFEPGSKQEAVVVSAEAVDFAETVVAVVVAESAESAAETVVIAEST